MRTAAHRLADRILNALGFGIMRVINDTGLQQVAQVTINAGNPMAETIDQVQRLAEYGFWSCPPDGAECVAVFLGGRRTGGVVVATGDRATRPKNLKAGEAIFYNGLTGARAVMDEDGKLHISCDVLVDLTLTARQLVSQTGASGTFTTTGGQTVTVQDGIVTNID